MNIQMDRKRLFKIQAYLIILIFLVNSFALKFYLYYSIWYFDMFMHFLGGFWVGFFFLWLLSFKNTPLDFSMKLIYKIIFFVLFIGVSWEIFEILFNNIIAQNEFNIFDTISDIFFDLSGGILAVLYFLKRIMLIEENKVE